MRQSSIVNWMKKKKDQNAVVISKDEDSSVTGSGSILNKTSCYRHKDNNDSEVSIHNNREEMEDKKENSREQDEGEREEVGDNEEPPVNKEEQIARKEYTLREQGETD